MSPQVASDAPDDLAFPPGLSIVNWTVNDGKGNVVVGQQKVQVLVLSDDFLKRLPNILKDLVATTLQSAQQIDNCPSIEICTPILPRLAASFESISRTILAMIRNEVQLAEHAETAQILVEIADSARAANKFLVARASTDNGADQAIHRTANLVRDLASTLLQHTAETR